MEGAAREGDVNGAKIEGESNINYCKLPRARQLHDAIILV